LIVAVFAVAAVAPLPDEEDGFVLLGSEKES
jgi:hypothetical protein